MYSYFNYINKLLNFNFYKKKEFFMFFFIYKQKNLKIKNLLYKLKKKFDSLKIFIKIKFLIFFKNFIFIFFLKFILFWFNYFIYINKKCYDILINYDLIFNFFYNNLIFLKKYVESNNLLFFKYIYFFFINVIK